MIENFFFLFCGKVTYKCDLEDVGEDGLNRLWGQVMNYYDSRVRYLVSHIVAVKNGKSFKNIGYAM